MANKNQINRYGGSSNTTGRLIDWIIPLGLFFLFFFLYNHGKITFSEMIKTSGLFAIALLGITLLIGPLTRILPSLDFLKVHRKLWGILSVISVLVHASLVTAKIYKFDFSRFINFTHPKYPGLLSGLLALVLLLLVTFAPNRKAASSLGPGFWKVVQLASYLALFLACLHFYLMESVGGVLVIKRLLGRITFGFAALVVLVRILIIFLPKKK